MSRERFRNMPLHGDVYTHTPIWIVIKIIINNKKKGRCLGGHQRRYSHDLFIVKRGQVLSAGRAPKRALHHVLSTIGQFRCVFANTVAPGSPPELSSLISNVVSICFPHFKMLLHSSLNHFCWWLLCTFSETNSSRDQSLFMMSQTQGIQPFGASHVVFTSQCSFTVLEITFANGKNTFDLIFVFLFFWGVHSNSDLYW